MIAVDTNVIVRLLTGDDKSQYQKSLRLFRSHDIFISITVLQETEWVLRYSYQFSKHDINKALLGLAGLDNVFIDNPTVLMQALEWHARGLDFSDALHLSHSAPDRHFYTFDQKLISSGGKVTSYALKKP
ncbi:MAG: type II toxin-antitoxin system VapC family toxin [Halioglobus sp.]|nr:type II toxin-antitoxin system VapC family toxin [Halioglobus sp.]